MLEIDRVLQGVEVRPADPADSAAILGLLEQMDSDDGGDRCGELSVAVIADRLTAPASTSAAFVAYREEEMVGLVVYRRSHATFGSRASLHIDDLYVAPQWRTQGLGRELVRQVARVAKFRKVSRVTWNVSVSNERAIRFYRDLGANLSDGSLFCWFDEHALAALLDEGPLLPPSQ